MTSMHWHSVSPATGKGSVHTPGAPWVGCQKHSHTKAEEDQQHATAGH
eukprot:CAMPEP_0171154652 /NCGR_PEP_ID=MMETSP0790-20130122/446_1 /TAXON_ID=2925 /ORGANISM="Alexandrium catenella, Strain OF101" /LENGTH=47 /DNA_ID= /DNA_START= /DNA_END= /DNA_ORIENTATION=